MYICNHGNLYSSGTNGVGLYQVPGTTSMIEVVVPLVMTAILLLGNVVQVELLYEGRVFKNASLICPQTTKLSLKHDRTTDLRPKLVKLKSAGLLESYPLRLAGVHRNDECDANDASDTHKNIFAGYARKKEVANL